MRMIKLPGCMFEKTARVCVMCEQSYNAHLCLHAELRSDRFGCGNIAWIPCRLLYDGKRHDIVNIDAAYHIGISVFDSFNERSQIGDCVRDIFCIYLRGECKNA